MFLNNCFFVKTTLGRTTDAMIPLVNCLLDQRNLDFILLGKITSDFLEQRFGWYRQLSSANYFNSVPQILKAEKIIRLCNFVNMGFDMSAIKNIYKENENVVQSQQEEDFTQLLNELDHFSFEICDEDCSDKAIIFYLAGYIAHSLMKKSTCNYCQEVIADKKSQTQLNFEDDPETIEEKMQRKNF